METDNNRSDKSGTPIIVALIGSLAIVTGAVIANWDKIRNLNQTTSSVEAEIGHSDARAEMVETAFRENEEVIESQRESALRIGSDELASTLKDIGDKTRRTHGTVQALHNEYKEALRTGDRLKASKLRTKLNEAVASINSQFAQFKFELGILVLECRTGQFPKRRFKNTEIQMMHEFMQSVQIIPPYGMRRDRRKTVEQVCRITTTESISIKGNSNAARKEVEFSRNNQPFLVSNSFMNSTNASQPSFGNAL